MVSETDVVMAYRLLLGREPENRDVVLSKVRHFQNLGDLRQDIFGSPEFLSKLGASRTVGAIDAGTKPLNWPPMPVETEVPQATLNRMMARIEREFLDLGSVEPHWSVLTEDRFRSENIEMNLRAFYETGETALSGIMDSAARCGIDMSGFCNCFELGCGLGRVTMWLAKQFSHVIGGDISKVHLDHARRNAATLGVDNVAFVHLNSLQSFQNLPEFDVFYSIIVLQHNPPPLMAYMLRAILARLNSGGIAYFQIPTYLVNYEFDAEAWLASALPVGDVEVHCLPQPVLSRIIADAACQVLEMREDGAVGAMAISNRLLIQKKG
jgi:SAM-dependent methyltransferase